MGVDLTKLTAAPWTYRRCPRTENYGYLGFTPTNSLGLPATDAEFIALARNDFDVKQRRGWHTEKCKDSNQWCVPQLLDFSITNGFLFDDNDAVAKAAGEACYQTGHDVGLLTKADAWYREHVENQILRRD